MLILEDEYNTGYLLDFVNELETSQVVCGNLRAFEFVSLLDLGTVLYGELYLLQQVLYHELILGSIKRKYNTEEEWGLQVSVNEEIDQYLFSYNSLTLYLNKDLYNLFLDWMETYISLLGDSKESFESNKERRVFRRNALYSDESEIYVIEIKNKYLLAFLIQMIATVIVYLIKEQRESIFYIPPKKQLVNSSLYSRVQLNGPFLNIKEELKRDKLINE